MNSGPFSIKKRIGRGNLKKQKPGNTVVEQGESRNLLQITNLSENKIEKQARSFKVAKDILSVKRTIVITGVQGSGKTFLAKSLVSDLQRNGHVLKSTWISDFRQLREEKMTPITNEIFIFDEVFYELQINEKFKETLETLKKFVTENEKPYVIVTIPSYNWEKNFEEFKVNFDWMHINLDERDKMEKRAILHSLLKRSDLPGEQANIIGNLESHLLKADSNSIGFPALISWICKQSSEESVEKLLKTPLKSISDKIDSLKNSLKVEESGKYLILAYMSLKDGKMNVDNVDTKLLDSLKESYVPGFVKDDLKKYAEDMVGYYLTRNEDGCYEFDSNIMKKIVLVSLAKQCTLFVKLNYENECLKHIIPKQLCPNDIGTIYEECFTTI